MSPIISSFTEIKSEWLQLLPNSISNSVFLTPQFQEIWWKNFGVNEDKCCFLQILNDQKELLGIAPFFIQGKTLRFFGNVALSDYLDVVVLKGREHEFYPLLISALKDLNNSWQSLFLLSVPQHSPTNSLFMELAQKEQWQTTLHQQNVCPVISLPRTWEEYLQMIGKKQRHEVKRKWKNLEEQLQPQFVVVSNANSIEKDVSDFIRLHTLSSTEKAGFWNEQQTQYFRDIITIAAENNWLKLFFLEIADQRVATMLCFDYNNQFYLYNSGYDPNQFADLSVGNVLTSFTIRTAIELGRSRYDFLRGDEVYKLRYGAVAEPIFDLIITR